MSARLTPAAVTSTTTSPSPAAGSGTSRQASRLSSITIACMATACPTGTTRLAGSRTRSGFGVAASGFIKVSGKTVAEAVRSVWQTDTQHWRARLVADGAGLENRYGETHRGFESHALRPDDQKKPPLTCCYAGQRRS